MGPNTGINSLAFGGQIDVGGGITDTLSVQLASPFILNTPKNFITTLPTSSFEALTLYSQNVDGQGNAERFFLPSSGSITLTAQSEALNGLTTGTSTANFREVDGDGADVAGGCTFMLTLNFNLAQGTANFQAAAPAGNPYTSVTTAPATFSN